ncbi:MAG: aspartate kinase [Ferruginibacter sp.]|nr:aspartate kinase [Ferruginibacter sp.]
MLVFKFGGASINSIERIKNTSKIINENAQQKILVVISAMGKTTNALEKIAQAYFENKKEEALLLFEQVKQNHLEVVKYLLIHNWKAAEDQLKDFFTEIEWMLHDKPVRAYDYYYDQIVCCGELFSTCIVAHYLAEQKVNVHWADVRDIFRTDNNFRDAVVDFEYTSAKIQDEILPFFNTHDIVLTQGFIGSTDENESTTLGREGSDYSAAIFANILNASGLTIWKDVPAVMNADPNKFTDAKNIAALNYTEVIEMAYYGAQVIHPKTIKPLQNKNIPLFVKSFLDTSLQGTVINNEKVKNLPPIIVLKNQQVLIYFKSKDFSFMEGKALGQLHKIFNAVKLQPNLTQNTAISFICCFDGHVEKTTEIATQASLLFDVEVERDLSLLTIRHYDNTTIEKLTKGKNIILEQRTAETLQAVCRN